MKGPSIQSYCIVQIGKARSSRMMEKRRLLMANRNANTEAEN
jgi:hypothetical protein